MKRIDQTTFGYPEGNCFMACIASILEVPLEKLPNLYEETCSWDKESEQWIHGDWWSVTLKAVRNHGWELIFVARGDVAPQGYAIAGGDSPREEAMTEDGENAGHAVVYLDGIDLVHDPHPDRTGLLNNEVTEWYLLLPPR